MKFKNEQSEIELIEGISLDGNPSCSDASGYSKKYQLGKDVESGTCYSVIVRSKDGFRNSCSITVKGGFSTIGVNSLCLREGDLFIAVGNLICSLDLPSLTLLWQRQVDWSACFGIHFSPDDKGIISHGEIDIAKIGFHGEIEWSVSGKDIFSEGFQIFPDHIEAIDFNLEKYRIDISSGRILLIESG